MFDVYIPLVIEYIKIQPLGKKTFTAWQTTGGSVYFKKSLVRKWTIFFSHWHQEQEITSLKIMNIEAFCQDVFYKVIKTHLDRNFSVQTKVEDSILNCANVELRGDREIGKYCWINSGKSSLNKIVWHSRQITFSEIVVSQLQRATSLNKIPLLTAAQISAHTFRDCKDLVILAQRGETL